jgi:hypothetical protein
LIFSYPLLFGTAKIEISPNPAKKSPTFVQILPKMAVLDFQILENQVDTGVAITLLTEYS